MEKLLNNLLESAKGNKKGLILLKNASVRCQNYELASKLREMEVKLFPETEETKKAKESAKKLNLLFRMVDLHVDEKTCYKIFSTLELFKKKKGKFDIKDASVIIAKTNEIFED